MSDFRFNVRVYGVLINNKQEVLVTDEHRTGLMFTKFPGGGLEFGEGTIDCLKREFREEMDREIEVVRHFYTTDYFQVSAFNPRHQLLSIYYLVNSPVIAETNYTSEKFNFLEKTEGAQIFRWIPVNQITEDEFMFPVDKIVALKIKEQFSENK